MTYKEKICSPFVSNVSVLIALFFVLLKCQPISVSIMDEEVRTTEHTSSQTLSILGSEKCFSVLIDPEISLSYWF